MKRDAVAEAEHLIALDDVAIYDACANVGQMVKNLPYSVLVQIVANSLLEEWGEN